MLVGVDAFTRARSPVGKFSNRGEAMAAAEQCDTHPTEYAFRRATSRLLPLPPSSLRRTLPLNRSPFDPLHFQPLLPTVSAKHRDKPLLVLDLDETLLHATLVSDVAATGGGSTDSGAAAPPLLLPPASSTGVLGKQPNIAGIGQGGSVEAYFVLFRPHLTAFLAFVSRRFELCFFTASTKAYATQVIGAMDSTVTRGAHRLFREHCADMDGKKIKDLSLLGRPLHRIVIVDNTEMSYHLQPRNGIPISSWYGDPNDRGLLDLLPLLDALSQSPNLVDALDMHYAEHPNPPSVNAVTKKKSHNPLAPAA